jgi:Sporulation protein YtfJ (Spore_YtfJ)
MADPLDDSVRKAQAEASADRLQALAAKIGADAGANAVFAKPVEREGVTVIPVARVRWGFGGGFGEGNGASGGSGGGGGVQASPMGFIEIHDGTAEYKSVRDPLRLAIAWLLLPVSAAAAALVMVGAAWMAARSLRNAFSVRRRWPMRQLSDLPRPHISDLPRPHLADLPRPHLADLPRPHLPGS